MNIVKMDRYFGLSACSLLAIVLFFISSCKKYDPWERIGPQERVEIERGCELLEPLAFRARVRHIKYRNNAGKLTPTWIYAMVTEIYDTAGLQGAIDFRTRYFDLSNWPLVKLHVGGDFLYPIEKVEVLVKKKGACAFANADALNKWVFLYQQYRYGRKAL